MLHHIIIPCHNLERRVGERGAGGRRRENTRARLQRASARAFKKRRIYGKHAICDMWHVTCWRAGVTTWRADKRALVLATTMATT